MTYFGFTKAIPFRTTTRCRPSSRRPTTSRTARPCAIAGVNVGKVTGDQPRRGRQAGRARDDADRQEGPADPQGRDDEDPPAHLPRGQLLRRRQPGLAVGADARTTATASRSTRRARRSSSTRSSARCRRRRARTCRRCCDELSTGPEGRGRRAATTASIPLLGARLPRQRDRRRRAAGHRSPTTSRATSTRPAPTAEALDRNREQLKSLVTDFDTTARRVRRARAGALGRRRRAAAHAATPAMPALGALNRSFPAVRGLIRAARPAVRSSGPAIDASMPVRPPGCAASCPSPSCAASSHDLRPIVPAADRAQPALGAALRAGLAGVELPERGRSCPGRKDKIEDKTFPARGPVYEEATKPLPGLAGESRSGDANGQWFRVMLTGAEVRLPAGHRQVLPHRPAAAGRQPADAAEPRAPAAARRRAVRDPAAARPAHRCPTRRRRASTSPSRRPPPSAAGAAEDRRLAAQGPQGRGLRRSRSPTCRPRVKELTK